LSGGLEETETPVSVPWRAVRSGESIIAGVLREPLTLR